MRALLTLIACCAFHGTPTFAQSKTITILEWNIEAGAAMSIRVLASSTNSGPSILLRLSEVANDAVDRFAKRWSSGQFAGRYCRRCSKLLSLGIQSVLEKLEASEISKSRSRSRARHSNPLRWPSVQHKSHSARVHRHYSHLARGSAELRKKQALLLVDWARHQSIQLSASADNNFDYDFTTSKGNESFDAFLA